MIKILKIIGIFIATIVALVILLFAFLTITDYSPKEIETLDVNNNTNLELDSSKDLSVITWNIGYAALGEKETFFLDDGEKSKPDNKNDVEKYLDGIIDSLKKYNKDFLILQEVDVDSNRSYGVKELKKIVNEYPNFDYSFALNYDVKFIPVPFPPLGKVEAGQLSLSKYKVSEAKRYAFPGNYSWPKKTIMLDRCFNISRIPVKDKKGDLLLINVHFSAYDDGSLRKNQLKYIKEFIIKEYEKGNYIVLGGDWNQTFDTINIKKYPLYKNGEFYTPYVISSDWLEDGWRFAINDNVPTYRLLNKPYEKGVTQVGVIDGFLVSPNVTINEVKVLDLEFKNSDHNPVLMKFLLN
ncbi:endonuclease/exonuclease/phosphatase family protein [Helicovermis profundi]|uniref:Endonuclease n=1 Tax=Helicovermis profundi TaxID=3065157 RepID=A0AAU9E2T8_9FIRM|nr:endonuclease [Clostridia bacterium S502]